MTSSASPPYGRTGVERRMLGRTEVRPSRIGFGTASVAGLFAAVDEETAQATLAAAWDAGIRYFDTAPHYGAGLAERRMGRALRAQPRAEYVVSTKVGRLLVDEGCAGAEHDSSFVAAPQLARRRDYSRDGVLRSLEQSLSRAGLDRFDVVLIHDPDKHWESAAGEAFPALAELRDQGAVSAIGVGMNQTAMLERFIRETDVDCILVANRWTLLDRRAGQSLLPLCLERDVGVVVGGALNSGVLGDPSPTSHYEYAPVPPAILDHARELQRACLSRGVPLAAAALQFPLRHPAVTSLLVAPRSVAELAKCLEELATPVPEALWDELRPAPALSEAEQ